MLILAVRIGKVHKLIYEILPHARKLHVTYYSSIISPQFLDRT